MRKIKTYTKLYQVIMGLLDNFFDNVYMGNTRKIAVLEQIIKAYKLQGDEVE
jgi:hypothetical protein